MRVDDGEGIALAAVPRAEVPFEVHAAGRVGAGDVGERLRRAFGCSHPARAWRGESAALQNGPNRALCWQLELRAIVHQSGT